MEILFEKYIKSIIVVVEQLYYFIYIYICFDNSNFFEQESSQNQL